MHSVLFLAVFVYFFVFVGWNIIDVKALQTKVQTLKSTNVAQSDLLNCSFKRINALEDSLTALHCREAQLQASLNSLARRLHNAY